MSEMSTTEPEWARAGFASWQEVPSMIGLMSLCLGLDPPAPNEQQHAYRRAQIVFLGSLFVGGDRAKVAYAVGLDADEVAIYADLLERNGIWTDGKVTLDDQLVDDEAGALIATWFVMNTLVATGELECVEGGYRLAKGA